MITAFAHWSGRIAPVFDTADTVRVVEHQDGVVRAQREESLVGLPLFQRAARLAEWKTDVVICGAISRQLHCLLSGYGISVVPFISGDLEELVQLWVNSGGFSPLSYAMPGCWHARGGMQRGGPFWKQENMTMFGKGSMGGGGGNRGMQKGGGRMGGPKGAGPGGFCLCPSCGHREPHERGVPCNQRRCPKCGTVMTRE